MNVDDYIKNRSKFDKKFAADMKKQDELMPFAISILNLRADSDLSQGELAKLLKVSKKDVDDWEKCRKAPSAEILQKLANISNNTLTISFEPNSNIAFG